MKIIITKTLFKETQKKLKSLENFLTLLKFGPKNFRQLKFPTQICLKIKAFNFFCSLGKNETNDVIKFCNTVFSLLNALGVYKIFWIFKGVFIGEGRLFEKLNILSYRKIFFDIIFDKNSI